MQAECLWGSKSAYELMSAMLVCTTPKGDLPHYSYIFRKPYPLGDDIRNVYCYSLEDMLHLDIQKVKGDMKALKFQHDTKGTVSFMKRLMMSKKWCGQMTSNDTYFSYRWSVE